MQTRIYDTFNNQTVSHHRSIEAAVKADRKFQRDVKRANGQNSYIPTTIQVRVDGEWVGADQYEVMAVKHALDM